MTNVTDQSKIMINPIV